MPGVAPLREAVAAKIESLYGRRYNPASEITVTAGATQAILAVILAIVHPGDEVIVLEPCYDSYVPNIELAGGRVVRVPLTPGSFRPDFDRIRAAIGPRTRAILINTPHNPSGMVWTREEMLTLQEILASTNVVLISDEVYEHMVYAPLQHWSAAQFEGLAARAFIVSSFGKTYHVTGWKVGTVATPADYTAELRKVHQFMCSLSTPPCNTPWPVTWPTPPPIWSCPPFTSANATCFAKAWRKPRSSCCPAKALTSSAWTSRI
jgi:methionine aminotransferase